jgi:alpha-L-fucosidase 2
LLPALPDAWKKEGFVKGLVLRGGYTISFAWKDGKVTTWRIDGNEKDKLKVRVPGVPGITKSFIP